MTFDPPTRAQAKWITGAMAAVMAGAFVAAILEREVLDALSALGGVLVLFESFRHAEWLLVDLQAPHPAPELGTVDHVLLWGGGALLVGSLLAKWLS